MGVSWFNGNRLPDSRPNRSYVTSAGIECRESRGHNILGRIDIPIVPDTTARTTPLTYVEVQFLQDISTI